MPRRCQLTGKTSNNAYKVSHSNRHTKRRQHANLHTKRVWWPEGNRWVKLRLSTRAIRTMQKKGVHRMAQQMGIDLNKA
ncbi:MAG: 50S ribosomal protein L28 [Cyanobacteria bacterium QS_8_64_29]|nr:MAG: 50S ribosomal protein L28 [Cyanobacteria bacterium QS_8_64_29]